MNREVLTIPAGGTIDIIDKHDIHAYPHPRSYYNSPFVAFRKRGGRIERLYSVQGKIVLNPNTDNFQVAINHFNREVQASILAYIKERKKSFGFERPDKDYMYNI